MELNKILKNKRIELKMTQNEVASLLNVSRQTISKYETDSKIPDDILKNICKLYKLNYREMVSLNKEDVIVDIASNLTKEKLNI